MLLSSKKIIHGFKAQEFNLINIDNNMISIDQVLAKNGLVVAFICNHCPYVKDLISRLVKDFEYLLNIEVGVVTIMPNDTDNYPEDSFESMKSFAKKNKFSFPYLIDKDQSVAKAYKAVCTPDFFCFDKNKYLFYRGRLDNLKYKEKQDIRETSLLNAVREKLYNNNYIENQISSMGCSIKWKNNKN